MHSINEHQWIQLPIISQRDCATDCPPLGSSTLPLGCASLERKFRARLLDAKRTTQDTLTFCPTHVLPEPQAGQNRCFTRIRGPPKLLSPLRCIPTITQDHMTCTPWKIDMEPEKPSGCREKSSAKGQGSIVRFHVNLPRCSCLLVTGLYGSLWVLARAFSIGI